MYRSRFRSCVSRKPSTSCSRTASKRKSLKERWIPAQIQDDASALMRPASLDLRFLELHVLARARIVFLEAQLLRLRARVLLGYVEEAGIGAADELDLDGCRLGHRIRPKSQKKEKRLPPPVRLAL